jgi:hypothetical protein
MALGLNFLKNSMRYSGTVPLHALYPLFQFAFMRRGAGIPESLSLFVFQHEDDSSAVGVFYSIKLTVDMVQIARRF